MRLRGLPPMYAVAVAVVTTTPTSATDVVDLTLSFDVSGTQPFTVGQVFAEGDVPDGFDITSDADVFQADVRNYWADGSVRYALLSGLTTAGTIQIKKGGTPYSASNVAEPTSFDATVAFTSVVDASSGAVAGGSFSASLSTARANGSGGWSRGTARKVRELLGPVMSEFHYYAPTADEHTHVWFFVRAYSNGNAEVETVVENGWTQVTSPGKRTYNVAYTLNGTSRYTGTGIVQFHHTRWSRVDWVGTDPGMTPQHNVEYLQTTAVLPSLAVTTLNSTAYTAKPDDGTKYSAWTRALADRPTPFALANINPALTDGGYVDNASLFAPWEMTYLVEGDARALWAIVGNSRAGGYFPVHYRDEDTGAPVRGSEHPALTLSDTSVGIKDNAGSGDLTPAPAGGAPTIVFGFSHGASYGYVAYLLTGRWSCLEELQFYNGCGDLLQPAAFKYNGFPVGRFTGQLREHAFMFRNKAQIAIACPSYLNGEALTSGEDYEQRVEADGRMDAEIDWYHASYVSGTAIATPDNTVCRQFTDNPFGHWYLSTDYDRLNDGQYTLGGMQAYYNCMTVLWGYVAEASTNANYAELAEFTARLPVGVMGAAPGSTTWDYRASSWYQLSFGTGGTVVDGVGDPGASSFRASWDAEWTFITGAHYTWTGDGNPTTWATDSSIRYFAPSLDAHTLNVIDASFNNTSSVTDALIAAVEMMREAAEKTTVTGAATAISTFHGSDQWVAALATNFKNGPAWAYQSRQTKGGLPYQLPSAGEVVAIGTNTATSVKPALWSAADWLQSASSSFGGGTFVADYSDQGAYVLAGTGGHDHADNVDALIFDFAVAAWSVIPNANGVTNDGRHYAVGSTNGSPYYEITGTEVPSPCHPYATLCPLPGGTKGGVIYLWRGATTTNPVNSAANHRFDLASGLWSRGGQVYPNSVLTGDEGDGVFDEARNRIWFVPLDLTNLNRMWYLDLADMLWKFTSSSTNSYTSALSSTSGERTVLHDGMLVRAVTGSASVNKLFLFDPDSPDPTTGWIQLTVSGTLPHDQNRWAPYNGKWFSYQGTGEGNTVTRITPPALPKTGTWTVDSVTLTGDTLAARAGTTNHYTRLIYVDALDCLAWLPGGAESVYLMKPE